MARLKPMRAVERDLFPLPRRAIWETPHLGTADCKRIAGCDDTCQYVIKDNSDHPHTAHAEWFCTHLAELVGIPGPICQIIQLLDGSTAFGSRWMDGALPGVADPAKPTAKPWWQLVIDGAIPLKDLKLALTRIYVFDLFVHNVDRHVGNFLFIKQNNTHAAYAFDYSRAWTWLGFPMPPLPMPARENTVFIQRHLSKGMGRYIIKAEAYRFIEVLRRVPVGRIERIIDDHPSNWLPQAVKDDIIAWWASPDMNDRLDGILKGVKDGTYL